MLFNSLGRINWSCRDFVFWLMLFRVMILFWRSLKGGVRLRAVFLRWVGKFRKSRRNYRSERRYLPDNRRHACMHRRRLEMFRGNRPFPDLKNKTAIIIDDG